MDKSIVCVVRLYVEISFAMPFWKLVFRIFCVAVLWIRWKMIFIFVHLNVTFWVINILLIDINMVGREMANERK